MVFTVKKCISYHRDHHEVHAHVHVHVSEGWKLYVQNYKWRSVCISLDTAKRNCHNSKIMAIKKTTNFHVRFYLKLPKSTIKKLC